MKRRKKYFHSRYAPKNPLTISSVILFLLIAFSTLNCKKERSAFSLPPITEEGKNTFGFVVNGKVWAPYCQCSNLAFGKSELKYLTSLNGNTLPIGFAMLSVNQVIDGTSGFEIRYPIIGGRLEIYKPGNILDSVSIQYIKANGDTYYNYRINQPAVEPYFEITKIDTVKNIVSGKFAFILYASIGVDRTDSIVVTDGRFDFRIGDYSRCSN